jgi:Protein of unknown function (DUF3228)
MAASTAARKLLRLDPFALRQWEQGASSGTDMSSISKATFMCELNKRWQANEASLVDGYAPFCKHVFVRNDFAAQIKVGALELSAENEHLVRTGYVSRRQGELAVLSRWFNRAEVDSLTPAATHFDVILYSRAQIYKENEARGEVPDDKGLYESDQWDWAVISIKGQDCERELPMAPITVMRNALGREEGGSGVKLDADAYNASVQYWSTHIMIK